jgi:hypothetical protein
VTKPGATKIDESAHDRRHLITWVSSVLAAKPGAAMLDAPLNLPDAFPQSLSAPTADYVAAINRHFAVSSGNALTPSTVSAAGGLVLSPTSSRARRSPSDSPELVAGDFARDEDLDLAELLPKRRRSVSDMSLVATGECVPFPEPPPLPPSSPFFVDFFVGLMLLSSELHCPLNRSSDTCTGKGVKDGRR